MLLILALLLAGPQEKNDCAGTTQLALNECAGRYFQRADAALNRQWKITLAKMHEFDAEPVNDGGPGYVAQALTAQRAWLAYRDAECVSEGYTARGGSMESMVVDECSADLTRQRTRQLASLMLGPRGPSICPGSDQLTMNECSGQRFQEADVVLNRQWQQTLAKMRDEDAHLEGNDGRPGYAAQALTAQRAWLTFRDAECTSQGYRARGGSMEGMLFTDCQTSLTRQRTRQLADLLKGLAP